MDDVRQNLTRLGSERLADALLQLAESSDAADELVRRLIATPQENTKRFKAKLAGLKRMRRFVGSKESSAFADKLQMMLEDLKAGDCDPRRGTELVAAFYEADGAAFGHCDDSFGCIGDVFRFDARDLFVHHASRCADKDWLCELVSGLFRKDAYGVRDVLIDSAGEYLPEEIMRRLVESLWQLAERETNQYSRRHFISAIESLARQMKDAPLFEKARRTAWPELSIAARMDIAEVWFEVGDAETSLIWLQRIPEEETLRAYGRDRLLFSVYEKLGDRGKMAETAWRIFRSDRDEETLAILLAAIGKDKRECVIEGETRLILQSDRLSYSDAAFLVTTGRMDDAETYLLGRTDQLNGDLYTSLLPLAESMEKDGCFLAASVVYRALLDSILRRAKSKYYHHGVRYLKKLDQLADKITEWGQVVIHRDYRAKLLQTHGRKSSFWSRYRE